MRDKLLRVLATMNAVQQTQVRYCHPAVDMHFNCEHSLDSISPNNQGQLPDFETMIQMSRQVVEDNERMGRICRELRTIAR